MTEWWEAVSMVMTKREPKTPMAFCNRMLWVVMAIIIAPLYSNIDPETKTKFVVVGIAIGVAIFVWVNVFAWLKPEHLLYGAEIHFEKWKTAFGTDRGLATSSDLKNPSANPNP